MIIISQDERNLFSNTENCIFEISKAEGVKDFAILMRNPLYPQEFFVLGEYSLDESKTQLQIITYRMLDGIEFYFMPESEENEGE